MSALHALLVAMEIHRRRKVRVLFVGILRLDGRETTPSRTAIHRQLAFAAANEVQSRDDGDCACVLCGPFREKLYKTMRLPAVADLAKEAQ